MMGARPSRWPSRGRGRRAGGRRRRWQRRGWGGLSRLHCQVDFFWGCGGFCFPFLRAQHGPRRQKIDHARNRPCADLDGREHGNKNAKASHHGREHGPFRPGIDHVRDITAGPGPVTALSAPISVRLASASTHGPFWRGIDQVRAHLGVLTFRAGARRSAVGVLCGPSGVIAPLPRPSPARRRHAARDRVTTIRDGHSQGVPHF